MSTLAAKSERTRRELVSAARSAFAEHGYDAVSLRDITESLGLTKGAMYHHFASKEELFEHAVVQTEQEIFALLRDAVAEVEAPIDRFVAACREYLRHATVPSRARLLLDDGPMVLGWTRWLDFATAAGAGGDIAQAYMSHIEANAVAGGQGPERIEPLAQFITGGLMNIARWIAVDREARLETGLAVVDGMLRRLLPDHAAGQAAEPAP